MAQQIKENMKLNKNNIVKLLSTTILDNDV